MGLERARLSTFGYPSMILPTLSKDFTKIRDFAADFLFQVTHYANERNKEVPMGQVCLYDTHFRQDYPPSTILIFTLNLAAPHHLCRSLNGWFDSQRGTSDILSLELAPATED